MSHHTEAPPLTLDAVPPLPIEASRQARLVGPEQHGAVAEKYRLLAHRLQRHRDQKHVQSVLVTSSIPAEGKTSIAANLASALARNGSDVLLLDADVRAPDVPDALGIPGDLVGLTDVLAGEVSLQRALRRITPLNLFLLPAGAPILEPVSLFESAGFRNLLEQLRPSFDSIVIDSPPLAPFADAHCLANLADGILLVVRHGVTPRSELDRSLGALAGLPLLGLVLNSFDEPRHEEYYSYYQRRRATRQAPLARAQGA